MGWQPKQSSESRELLLLRVVKVTPKIVIQKDASSFLWNRPIHSYIGNHNFLCDIVFFSMTLFKKEYLMAWTFYVYVLKGGWSFLEREREKLIIRLSHTEDGQNLEISFLFF